MHMWGEGGHGAQGALWRREATTYVVHSRSPAGHMLVPSINEKHCRDTGCWHGACVPRHAGHTRGGGSAGVLAPHWKDPAGHRVVNAAKARQSPLALRQGPEVPSLHVGHAHSSVPAAQWPSDPGGQHRPSESWQGPWVAMRHATQERTRGEGVGEGLVVRVAVTDRVGLRDGSAVGDPDRVGVGDRVRVRDVDGLLVTVLVVDTVGVRDGVSEMVGVPAPVGVTLTVPVPVGVTLTVPVRVGVTLTAPVRVGVTLTVPVPVGVTLTVPVPVGVTLTVPVPVGVTLTDAVVLLDMLVHIWGEGGGGISSVCEAWWWRWESGRGRAAVR